MSGNYKYILLQIGNTVPDGTILDFGCGKGDVVKQGLAMGLDIYGAETFFKDNDRIAVQNSSLKEKIHPIEENKIDCADNKFDVIISNQVIEHIDNLPEMVAELDRVSKSNSEIFAIFPTKNIWLEGHVGLPFAHRLTKRSKSQYWYLLLARKLGLGFYKENKSHQDWAKRAASKLNDYCYYRSREQIIEIFSDYFIVKSTKEDEYLVHKLQNKGFLKTAAIIESLCHVPVLKRIVTLLVRKFLSDVMILVKR